MSVKIKMSAVDIVVILNVITKVSIGAAVNMKEEMSYKESIGCNIVQQRYYEKWIFI